MNFTKDQLLALMNTIDFATDNDASYEEYTILSDGSSDLEPIRDMSEKVKMRYEHQDDVRRSYSHTTY